MALSLKAQHTRLNEIQVIGSHNSYKQLPDSRLRDLIAPCNIEDAEAIAYQHPNI